MGVEEGFGRSFAAQTVQCRSAWAGVGLLRGTRGGLSGHGALRLGVCQTLFCKASDLAPDGNLKRVINILGISRTMKAVTSMGA